jgi:hypothetical protein
MSTTVKGNLVLEKNPAFLPENLQGASVGKNEITELVLSCFDEEADKIRRIIASYNPATSPIENHYSFSVSHIGRCTNVKLRIHKKTNLLKLIDWSTPKLIRKPLAEWIGMEFTITVRLAKYNFNVSSFSGAPDNEETLEGGANKRLRGVSFIVEKISAIL